MSIRSENQRKFRPVLEREYELAHAGAVLAAELQTKYLSGHEQSKTSNRTGSARSTIAEGLFEREQVQRTILEE